MSLLKKTTRTDPQLKKTRSQQKYCRVHPVSLTITSKTGERWELPEHEFHRIAGEAPRVIMFKTIIARIGETSRFAPTWADVPSINWQTVMHGKRKSNDGGNIHTIVVDNGRLVFDYKLTYIDQEGTHQRLQVTHDYDPEVIDTLTRFCKLRNRLNPGMVMMYALIRFFDDFGVDGVSPEKRGMFEAVLGVSQRGLGRPTKDSMLNTLVDLRKHIAKESASQNRAVALPGDLPSFAKNPERAQPQRLMFFFDEKALAAAAEEAEAEISDVEDDDASDIQN